MWLIRELLKMATIKAGKYKSMTINPTGWIDKVECEYGPTLTLESDSLDKITDMLPAIWNKGWEWATITSEKYKYVFYSSGMMHSFRL